MGRRAWLLGAGFSKFISDEMPLMSELGRDVCRFVSVNETMLALLSPPERSTLRSGGIPLGDLELWLTTLTSPQPFLDEGELLRRRSLAVELTRIIADQIETAQRRARGASMPPWLSVIAGLWHHSGDAVLTFNYDTLIESCLLQLRLISARTEIESRSVIVDVFRDYPPLVPTNGRGGSGFAETLELIKLHGSVNWFRLRGTDQARRADEILAAWCPESPEPPHYLEAPLRGSSNAILLPQADKSTGYADPAIANLWRRARQRLEAVDEFVLFGYSLPLTDTSAGALLAQTIGEDVPVTVIDPAADVVRDRLRRLGLGQSGHDIDPCSGEFRAFLDEIMSAESADRGLSTVSRLQAPYYVAVRDQAGIVWPVVDARSTESGVDLILGAAPLVTPSPYVSTVRLDEPPSSKPWRVSTAAGTELHPLGFRDVAGALESSNIVLDVVTWTE